MQNVWSILAHFRERIHDFHSLRGWRYSYTNYDSKKSPKELSTRTLPKNWLSQFLWTISKFQKLSRAPKIILEVPPIVSDETLMTNGKKFVPDFNTLRVIGWRISKNCVANVNFTIINSINVKNLQRKTTQLWGVQERSSWWGSKVWVISTVDDKTSKSSVQIWQTFFKQTP